jgi:DNA-binding MurR/RpiR family transcriptional regulator
VDAVIARIAVEFDTLSRQQKLIARYVEQHRDRIGLDGILELAAHCGVQPSAVVRFAKRLGFSGFSQMQAVFRDGISRQIAPGRSYHLRLREVIEGGERDLSSLQIAQGFLTGAMAAMEELRDGLDAEEFERAVQCLVDTDQVWVVGVRRSFPVASYLAYALQHTDKRVGLVSVLGAMQQEQVRSVRAGDAVLAVSFAPYAPESAAFAELAVQRGARLIAITDSRMGELARLAESCLIVHDHATFGFRALTGTMGLAQSLFLAVAYRLELTHGAGPGAAS